MGANEMIFEVMDSTGHTRQIFDPNQAPEVEAAREMFKSLSAKGYKAFFVGKDGEQADRMKEFDPKAGKFIMVPPIVGG